MGTHFLTVPIDAALLATKLSHRERVRPLALVVDDDPVITATLAEILSGSGLAAITSPDAQHALETALLIPPEILISDLGLPDMDGLNLALEVTRTVTDCAVILFVGPGHSIDSAAFESSGIAFRILVKPVHPTDLLQSISEVLARRPAEGPKPGTSPAPATPACGLIAARAKENGTNPIVPFTPFQFGRSLQSD